MGSDKSREDHSVSSNSHEDPWSGELPASLDTLLEILAEPRRRYALEYFWNHSDKVASFEVVTSYILGQLAENREEVPEFDELQIALQHHHIPKMADAGLVDYDTRSQEIRYYENERFETFYDVVVRIDID